MTADESGADPDVDGMALGDAVDAVVAADGSRDRTAVRETLQAVTADGRVDASALDERVADVSRDVASAEGEVDRASFELTRTRETAEGVRDVDAVGRRLAAFESEVETLQDRAATLGEDLEAVSTRVDDPGSLYAVAAEVRAVGDAAESVQGAADSLVSSITEFRDWLNRPEAWVHDLQLDLNAVEETLDSVDELVEALAATVEDGAETAVEDPAAVWYEGTLRVRVVALMLEDVRAELADLETLADRGRLTDDWYPGAVAGDLEDHADRRAAAADRLDALAREAWTDRFADRLEEFEAGLADIEPPVDWQDLESTVSRYRVEPDAERAP